MWYYGSGWFGWSDRTGFYSGVTSVVAPLSDLLAAVAAVLALVLALSVHFGRLASFGLLVASAVLLCVSPYFYLAAELFEYKFDTGISYYSPNPAIFLAELIYWDLQRLLVPPVLLWLLTRRRVREALAVEAGGAV